MSTHPTQIDPAATVDTVVVITGAAPLWPGALAGIPDDATVIAADGALDDALAAGLEPTVLVGDLDSVSPSGLEWADEHATVERHDPDKDQTDTELALAAAADLNPRRLVLVSGGGDRLDHTLAAITALGHPSLTSIPTIEGWWGDQELIVLHGPGRISIGAAVGTTLSLLALHGTCSGVTITGVRWPLVDATLESGVSIGVSNETIAAAVDIAVSAGVLTVVQPPQPPMESS